VTPRPTRSGVLILDKPRGPTSHDVVVRARRALRTRRVGHAGTLDPMATGVLVVAVDEATKLVPWLTGDDKAYEAVVRLGVETDTLDAEGEETGRRPVGPLEDAALSRASEAERARTVQVPPAFSAIRTGVSDCGFSDFFWFLRSLSGIAMASFGCSRTCLRNFAGAGASGTTDCVSFASGFSVASRCASGMVFTMLTPTEPLLAWGAPQVLLRCR